MKTENSFRASVASVIIPVHNGAHEIGEQLTALTQQSAQEPFEVIVVLNRCTDETVSVVNSFRDSLDVRAIVADEKASAAYARNRGANAAGTRHLLFCDADDRVGSTWVSEMSKMLRSADFGGGRLVIDRERLPKWRLAQADALERRGGLHTCDGRILYPISASFGCRSHVFRTVGGFDEQFGGAATEDVDLAIRLYRAGHRMGFASDAELLYRPRPTLREMLRQSRGYANGDALLASKEGRLVPVSRVRGIAQVVWAIATRVWRQHTLRPSALVFSAAKAHYRQVAQRAVASRGDIGQQIQDPVVDYTLALPGPETRWLALAARRSTARRRFESAREVAATNLVAAHLSEGDTLLDLDQDTDGVSIVAALTVGPGGSVHSYAPDIDRCTILEQNLARHGVSSIVRSFEQLGSAIDFKMPIQLVRIDQQLNTLHPPAAYSDLIQHTRSSKYMVPSELLEDSKGSVANDLRESDYASMEPGDAYSDWVVFKCRIP